MNSKLRELILINEQLHTFSAANVVLMEVKVSIFIVEMDFVVVVFCFFFLRNMAHIPSNTLLHLTRCLSDGPHGNTGTTCHALEH